MIPRVRNVPSWEMTRVELARVFALIHGFKGMPSGWISDSDGVFVAHGWVAFADRLEARGWIQEGKGVFWTKAVQETGGIPRLGPPPGKGSPCWV
jgi:hypothetical protein